RGARTSEELPIPSCRHPLVPRSGSGWLGQRGGNGQLARRQRPDGGGESGLDGGAELLRDRIQRDRAALGMTGRRLGGEHGAGDRLRAVTEQAWVGNVLDRDHRATEGGGVVLPDPQRGVDGIGADLCPAWVVG